jgi:hypothetical protein
MSRSKVHLGVIDDLVFLLYCQHGVDCADVIWLHSVSVAFWLTDAYLENMDDPQRLHFDIVREVVVSVEFADSQAIVGYITAVQRREEVFVETFESDRCREHSLGLAEILS